MRKPAVFFLLACLALAGFVLSPAILKASLAYPFFRNTFFGLVLFNFIGHNGFYLPVVVFCLVHLVLFGVLAPLGLLALAGREPSRARTGGRAGVALLAVGAAILLAPFVPNLFDVGLTGSALVINLLFLFPLALGVGLHALYLFPAATRLLLGDRVPRALSTGLAALAALILIRWSYQHYTGIALPLAIVPAGVCFALAQRMVGNKAVVFVCFFLALFMAMLPQKESIIVPIGSLVATFLVDFNAAMLALAHVIGPRRAPAA